jgi:hypothetical protein
MEPTNTKLCVGDWVEVRSKEEILQTLDNDGRLDGMPFMAEMFAFCGQRFQIYKRAHKTCDTVFPIRGRWLDDSVHLNTRCDGSSHGGCQAGCLIFWKNAWLKPIVGNSPADPGLHFDVSLGSLNATPSASACAELTVLTRGRVDDPYGGEPSYVCQATQLPYATKDLDWWDIRQYLEDYSSGNVSLWQIICGGVYSLYYALSQAGIGLGPAMRWFYDRFYPLWGGTPFPRKVGTIAEGEPTPAATLNLQPGELVRIKTHDEILKTLNTASKNRGLYWDAEEVVYCGSTHRVLKRLTRIIDEGTGKMQEMKTPCIILDSVVCQSRYSACRMFCPRGIYGWWREIWLERVEPAVSGTRGNEDTLYDPENATMMAHPNAKSLTRVDGAPIHASPQSMGEV